MKPANIFSASIDIFGPIRATIDSRPRCNPGEHDVAFCLGLELFCGFRASAYAYEGATDALDDARYLVIVFCTSGGPTTLFLKNPGPAVLRLSVNKGAHHSVQQIWGQKFACWGSGGCWWRSTTEA